LDLTTDWKFEPHTILLKEARKEAWCGQRGSAKNAKTRAEALGSEEGLKAKSEL
jgi:hypothetical protein